MTTKAYTTLCLRCSAKYLRDEEASTPWLCASCAHVERIARAYLALRACEVPEATALRIAVEDLPVEVPAWPKERPWLVLVGPSGTGKTTAAAKLLGELRRRGHTTPQWVDVVSLYEERKAAIDTPGRRDPLPEALAAGALVLDDLGAEPAREFAVETVRALVAEHYRRMRPVVITTNVGEVDPDTGKLADTFYDLLAARYDGRTADRVVEWGFIAFMGTYHRAERGAWLAKLPDQHSVFPEWDRHVAAAEAAGLAALVEHEVGVILGSAGSTTFLRRDGRGAGAWADDFRQLRERYPTVSAREIVAWIDGKSYDPAKDPEVLAEMERRRAAQEARP